MCLGLGGRIAESIVFNSITTGAQNDLDKVTKIANSQVYFTTHNFHIIYYLHIYIHFTGASIRYE